MPEDVDGQSLRDFVLSRMITLNLSESELAHKVDMTRTAIQHIISGKTKNLPLKKLNKWATTLQVDCSEVVRFYVPPGGRPNPTETTIGETIRVARIKKELSQRELAKKVGISQPIINDLESKQGNKCLIGNSILNNLASVLDLTPEQSAELREVTRTVRKPFLQATKPTTDSVGNFLRHQRVKRGLKQSEVEQKLSICQTYLSKLETGLQKPSVKIRRKLELFYNCEIPIDVGDYESQDTDV